MDPTAWLPSLEIPASVLGGLALGPGAAAARAPGGVSRARDERA